VLSNSNWTEWNTFQGVISKLDEREAQGRFEIVLFRYIEIQPKRIYLVLRSNCVSCNMSKLVHYIRDENEKERELQHLGIRFLERLPCFLEIPEKIIPLVTEDFQKFNPKFWMHIKHPRAPSPFSGSSLIYLSLSLC